ncbi:MAG: hypothetical protein HRU09_00785 [Oligoflexales bacterium]|nr:hypothetical protein [Oligoflexales bacterium]
MDLLERLDKIAYKKSQPFCYSCYVRVKGSHCRLCGSDDLMREDKNGLDWGIDHIIETILDDEPVEHACITDSYDLMLDECYPEVQMGYNTWTPSDLLKNMSPGDYEYGKGEHLDHLIESEQVIEINGNYYWEAEISELVEGLENELEEENGDSAA